MELLLASLTFPNTKGQTNFFHIMLKIETYFHSSSYSREIPEPQGEKYKMPRSK